MLQTTICYLSVGGRTLMLHRVKKKNDVNHDKWIGGVLHYTGMGKTGDQDIDWAQNATLAGCGKNGVDIHLFEVIEAGEYIYCGRIELVEDPYTEVQPGEDGEPRQAL